MRREKGEVAVAASDGSAARVRLQRAAPLNAEGTARARTALSQNGYGGKEEGGREEQEEEKEEEEEDDDDNEDSTRHVCSSPPHHACPSVPSGEGRRRVIG